MRRVVLVIAALALSLDAVAAASLVHWNGAGWYQIEDVVIDGAWQDGWILAGPFDSKTACEEKLPGGDKTFERYCEYLESKPSWD